MLDIIAWREAQRTKNTSQEQSPICKRRISTPVKVLYAKLRKEWERYPIAIQICQVNLLTWLLSFRTVVIPNAEPDLETLQALTVWWATEGKGKLDDKPSISTLMYKIGRFAFMYRHEYGNSIHDDTIARVHDFIQTDLKDDFGIRDTEYEKTVADWSIVFAYNLGCIFLLIADDGERIGAVVSSDCYRKDNVALCYKDIKLFRMPDREPDLSPQFKLETKYNNRKNERGNPKKFLEQTYFIMDTPGSCVVSWLLALMFLDKAFEHYSTPSELFRPNSSSRLETPINFRKDIMDIPLFRRLVGKGSRKLSQTLPISSTSVTEDAQRVVSAAGFPQRFTFYSIRRGLSNALHDNMENVDTSRIKQLMGHSGLLDAIFLRYYQSRKVNIDSGNIFRQELPRAERTQTLNMRSKRDVTAPRVLSTQQRDELYAQDTEIQRLLKTRERLHQELKDLSELEINEERRERIGEESRVIWKQLGTRKTILRKYGLRALRKEHFESIAERGAQASNTDPPEASTELQTLRHELAQALFPQDSKTTSTLLAVEQLVAHGTHTQLSIIRGRKRKKAPLGSLEPREKRIRGNSEL
ncbi:hypothetical protein BOTCAL_0078g00220 [Botryotinia calthae]|uniref:Uncharacterized protein n=1 Tax=Botryotinia calthae TaxID=38488 RepID=A0A4Y8D866_9HELO|nr:hypothetical protein BOTCAL_0078g00220 [Botryotinia calthae]